MKKLLIALTISALAIIGCNTLKPVSVGMPEQQFLNEHPRSRVVEMSAYRTVYKDRAYNMEDTSTKFYYFTKGTLLLMDEGFFPKGAKAPVPTPM